MKIIVTTVRSLVLSLLFVMSVTAFAYDAPVPSANTLSPLLSFAEESRSMFGGLRKIVLRAAELMPEAHYGYTPVETTRTFGRIAAHIAQSQNAMCAAAQAEKPAPREYEKTHTTKAQLIEALTESFARCEQAYGALNDETVLQQVKVMGDKSRLGVLDTNMLHTVEHYGNMVTYMRMKGLVPPTSDPAFMKALMTP